jgi:hypothetical protein
VVEILVLSAIFMVIIWMAITRCHADGGTFYLRTSDDRLKQELRIEIDEIKRDQEVASIEKSDFFQDILSKVDDLRNEE